MSYTIKSYSDFDKSEQKELRNQLDNAKDCQYVDENEADDYFVDTWVDIYSIDDEVRIYLDDEKIAQDMAMDYTSVSVGDDSYYVVE